MGLDIVEVVMRTEKEFDIKILDEDAEQCATCGELHEVVLRKLRERGEMPDGNTTWEKLRIVVADEISVPMENITREAHFVYDLDLS